MSTSASRADCAGFSSTSSFNTYSFLVLLVFKSCIDKIRKLNYSSINLGDYFNNTIFLVVISRTTDLHLSTITL